MSINAHEVGRAASDALSQPNPPPVASPDLAAPELFLGDRVALHAGDCVAVLAGMTADSLDSCVTDPPYHLQSIVKRFAKTGRTDKTRTTSGPHQRTAAGFMGKQWDGGDVAFRAETWAEVYRVLKPGAYLLAFAGTRTYHRIACAIEDAGFIVYDQIGWAYGSGFPKSHNIGKAIDRHFGQERTEVLGIKPGHEGFANRGNLSSVQSFKGTFGGDGGFDRPWMDDPEKVERYHQRLAPATREAAEWEGWGTALKPAWEPICLARKPLSEGTIAANVLKWGTGALNIDGCRIETEARPHIEMNRRPMGATVYDGALDGSLTGSKSAGTTTEGRWPANIIHDGSAEVLVAFPDAPGQQQDIDPHAPSPKTSGIYGKMSRDGEASATRRYTDDGSTDFSALPGQRRGDKGSAARFFYAAKADDFDRIGSKHPTVKPVDLMQYLVRLITPPRGCVLDPFAGTGTTGEAAWREGFSAVLIEREEEYRADIRRRMALALAGPEERARAGIKEKLKGKPIDAGPLFGGTPLDERGGQAHLRSIRGRKIGPIGLRF